MRPAVLQCPKPQYGGVLVCPSLSVWVVPQSVLALGVPWVYLPPVQLMVMRHAKEKMEEDLKAKDAEIEALRAWAGGVAAGSGAGALPPIPPTAALAPTLSSGAPGAGSGSPAGAASAKAAGAGSAAGASESGEPHTPARGQGTDTDAGRGAGAGTQEAAVGVTGVSPGASPSDKDRQNDLAEVHSVYGEHLKLLEDEVVSIPPRAPSISSSLRRFSYLPSIPRSVLSPLHRFFCLPSIPSFVLSHRGTPSLSLESPRPFLGSDFGIHSPE